MLQPVFTEWLQALEWLEPVLCLSFLDASQHRQGSRCFANRFKDRSGDTEGFESCRGQAGLTEYRVPLYPLYLFPGFIFKPIVSSNSSCSGLWL